MAKNFRKLCKYRFPSMSSIPQQAQALSKKSEICREDLQTDRFHRIWWGSRKIESASVERILNCIYSIHIQRRTSARQWTSTKSSRLGIVPGKLGELYRDHKCVCCSPTPGTWTNVGETCRNAKGLAEVISQSQASTSSTAKVKRENLVRALQPPCRVAFC